MAPHSSTLDWEIPWTEEPGGLQSTGSDRIGHDQATKQQQTNMFIHWDYLGEQPMLCSLSLIYKSASSFGDIISEMVLLRTQMKTEQIIFIVHVQHPQQPELTETITISIIMIKNLLGNLESNHLPSNRSMFILEIFQINYRQNTGLFS